MSGRHALPPQPRRKATPTPKRGGRRKAPRNSAPWLRTAAVSGATGATALTVGLTVLAQPDSARGFFVDEEPARTVTAGEFGPGAIRTASTATDRTDLRSSRSTTRADLFGESQHAAGTAPEAQALASQSPVAASPTARPTPAAASSTAPPGTSSPAPSPSSPPPSSSDGPASPTPTAAAPTSSAPPPQPEPTPTPGLLGNLTDTVEGTVKGVIGLLPKNAG